MVGLLGAMVGLLALSTLEPGAEDRVDRARRLKGAAVQELAKVTGLSSPVRRVFFRAFKEERVLEVWGTDSAAKPMVLVKAYPIAMMSGGIGPKRMEGDRQVPEGRYKINRFNPLSTFRLSLGLDYPTALDRKLGDKDRPGGDIFIHGDRKSIGCLAMTDELIDEIYLLALDAREAGQRMIAVHIFPARLTDANFARLSKAHPVHAPFWKSLRPMYDRFEEKRLLPR